MNELLLQFKGKRLASISTSDTDVFKIRELLTQIVFKWSMLTQTCKDGKQTLMDQYVVKNNKAKSK